MVGDIIQGSQVAQGELSKLLETPRLGRCLCRGIVGVEVSTEPGGVLCPYVGADHRARSALDVKTIRRVYSSPDWEICEGLAPLEGSTGKILPPVPTNPLSMTSAHYTVAVNGFDDLPTRLELDPDLGAWVITALDV